jgi:hypothetical protein
LSTRLASAVTLEQSGERTAGLDLGPLPRVADQDDLGSPAVRMLDELKAQFAKLGTSPL